MLQLQQLHEPLHVAQRAAPQLEMSGGVHSARQPLRLDAGLDALHLPHVRLRDGCWVPHLIGEALEGSQHAGVADRPPRAEERLRLPGERPAIVVGAIAVQRTHDSPVLALRSEPQVEVERQAQILGEPLELAHDDLGPVCRVLRGGTGRLVDVDDVRVAAEAELATAVAAEGDDAELDAVAPAMAERKRAGEQGGGDVAETLAELLDGDHAEDAREGQPEHLATPGGPQGERRGIHVVGMARDGRRRLVEEVGKRARAQFAVGLKPGGRLRDALEQHPDEARAREHMRQPVGGARGVAQHPEEPVGLAQVVAQPAKVQQPEIGVRTLGEPAEHHWQ